ncbi:TerD family protein [Ruminococcus albus]|uniref:Stress protein n=1 Tax=Ruminococcus albus (strain ATCC 27210 / DSM 20455 / JCM 14654 / NCDO 2250 / 7) TaxID=697329 RepID=E6UKF9_RUMA7|nr:TerD family protein [Ruminococcus albus]ADU24155.1 stress protein [Ruminococcus albus 7 = DSM 20455]
MENTNLGVRNCGLVSYKINDDVLAEVLANNGFSGVGFDSSSGVRTVRTDDGLIFAKEGGEAELPQMIFMAWSGCGYNDLNAEDKTAYNEMKCTIGAQERADCLSYGIRSEKDDTVGSKLKVISELFAQTDIADKLDITVTRSSAAADGEEVFGFERIGFKNGSQVFWQLNFAGGSYTEDNAALLFKDGRLSITDADGHEWENGMVEEAMLSLNDAAALEGVTVLEKLSCRNIEKLVLLPVFLEVSDGALKGCTSLKEFDILKKNITIGRDVVGSGVVIGGCKGSTAEYYAVTGGAQFLLLEAPERKAMEFEIADGIVITADDHSVLRGADKKRLTLNDVGFVPYEDNDDDIDCEIIVMDTAEAEASELTVQLSSFGTLVDTETVRNDRNGYIKATIMRSTDREDIYSCVLEIDHSGTIICIHAEKQFDEEEITKGAEKALFERIKQLGESVQFGRKAVKGTAAVPNAVPASAETEPEAETEETIVPENYTAETEPEAETAETIASETYTTETEPEVETAEAIAPEIYTTETEPEAETAEAIAPEIYTTETEPEAETEETIAPETYTTESEPEAETEETIAPETYTKETEPEAETAETIAPEISAEKAEYIGEQNNTADDEIIDVEPEEIRSAEEGGTVRLVRGARFDLNDYASQMLVIDMDYQAEEGIDIDGYIFLLTENGKVRSDADLVFFGQKASVDKAINNHPQQTRMFTVELSKLDSEINKLAVAFAIYGDVEGQAFGKVNKPVVRISCGGKELCSYELSGLDDERSVVAMEIYNNNGWKAKTIGLGFRQALKTLCGSYGVDVKE